MKTTFIVISERLLRAVNKVATATKQTRPELFRNALGHWLASVRRREHARADREAYLRQPVTADEFAGLINAQAFTDDPEFDH
jgi:predicted transcriptional regulator